MSRHRQRIGRRARSSAILATAVIMTLSPGTAGFAQAAPAATGSAASTGSRASVPEESGPELSSYLAAFGYGLAHPNAAPAGANDWDCRPGKEHPRPVVLVHGTWMNAFDSFASLAPQLARNGYCVFALNYGQASPIEGGGLGPVLPGRNGVGYMEESAKQLAQFVDRVRAVTGSEQVDLVGYSQGGTIGNQYVKFEGGAGKVSRLISFGATHHGTTLLGLASLARTINNLGIDILGFYEPFVGHANVQQAIGSPFLVRMNQVGDTVPGIEYTVVGTRHDQVTNPFELTFLIAGTGATVHNIVLQHGCEQDLSDHLTMMYSPRAASIVLRALEPVGTRELVCTFNPWVIGGGGTL